MSLDMNPEVRAQWCAALRSGDYQQAKRALRRGDSYCCLGVLCDLAVRAGVLDDATPARFDPDHRPGRMQYDGRSDYLPPSVQKWAGLSEDDPVLGAARSLATANDAGCSFAEIADLIDGGVS
jgi:hypothetical protein